MICVECGEYIKRLYIEYQNGYIKLTDCPSCSKTADKYIEFDKVLLFIDVLLLKPQAYKHLVFNILENPDSNWSFRKYVRRIRFLTILFEIYLIWAYAEKSTETQSFVNPFLINNSILQKNAYIQYFYFALMCVSNDVITHILAHWFFLNYMRWSPKGILHDKSQSSYLKDIISLTILISSSTKLFPILMLIWPYDNISIASIINSIANVNLIESLRIVTNRSRIYTFQLFILIVISKFFLTKALLITLLSRGELSVMNQYFHAEFNYIIFKTGHILHSLNEAITV